MDLEIKQLRAQLHEQRLTIERLEKQNSELVIKVKKKHDLIKLLSEGVNRLTKEKQQLLEGN